MSSLLVCRIIHSRQDNHMFLTVNTELLTMLMTSLARDADALGSIKVESRKTDFAYVACIHFYL